MDGENKLYAGAAYFGLNYIIRHASTIFCMSDIKDINTDISLYESEPGKWRSALYLYDAIEGGVGYAEKIFERIEEVLAVLQGDHGQLRMRIPGARRAFLRSRRAWTAASSRSFSSNRTLRSSAPGACWPRSLKKASCCRR